MKKQISVLKDIAELLKLSKEMGIPANHVSLISDSIDRVITDLDRIDSEFERHLDFLIDYIRDL